MCKILLFMIHLEQVFSILPTPGEAKAKAMPGRLYIHTINNKINTTFVSSLNSPRKGCPWGMNMCV